MLVYKRGNRHVLADYKFDAIYNYYKERWGEKALPKDKVKLIYQKLFPAIVKLMVFENLDYRMPSRLGYLRVKKKLVEPKIDMNGNLDTRNLSVNWKKTKRLWQEVYPNKNGEEIKLIEGKPIVRELNEHSNNYRVMFFWDKLTCNIKNQSAYFVKMTRDNCTTLSHGVKHNNLHFYLYKNVKRKHLVNCYSDRKPLSGLWV